MLEVPEGRVFDMHQQEGRLVIRQSVQARSRQEDPNLEQRFEVRYFLSPYNRAPARARSPAPSTSAMRGSLKPRGRLSRSRAACPAASPVSTSASRLFSIIPPTRRRITLRPSKRASFIGTGLSAKKRCRRKGARRSDGARCETEHHPVGAVGQRRLRLRGLSARSVDRGIGARPGLHHQRLCVRGQSRARGRCCARCKKWPSRRKRTRRERRRCVWPFRF